MRKVSIGVLALSAFLAFPPLVLAKEAKPATPPGQIVTVAGKSLCYGEVPLTTKCDFRLPVPTKSATAASYEAPKAAKDTVKTKAASSGHATTR